MLRGVLEHIPHFSYNLQKGQKTNTAADCFLTNVLSYKDTCLGIIKVIWQVWGCAIILVYCTILYCTLSLFYNCSFCQSPQGSLMSSHILLNRHLHILAVCLSELLSIAWRVLLQQDSPVDLFQIDGNTNRSHVCICRLKARNNVIKLLALAFLAQLPLSRNK